MIEYYHQEIKRKVTNIILGEIFVTKNPKAVLNTVLGSCVAVCLADRVNGVYGINHFMMPGGAKNSAVYGTHSTTALISRMVAQGAEHKHLIAKVYGGGKTIPVNYLDVGNDNARFIEKFLDELNIPIVDRDLGGNYGRNIMFFCDTGKVEVKITSRKNTVQKAV